MALVKTIKNGDKLTFDFSGSDIRNVEITLLHGPSATFAITANKLIPIGHIKVERKAD
jgi:hypothetical protein